jgi:hypothetical protein
VNGLRNLAEIHARHTRNPARNNLNRALFGVLHLTLQRILKSLFQHGNLGNADKIARTYFSLHL